MPTDQNTTNTNPTPTPETPPAPSLSAGGEGQGEVAPAPTPSRLDLLIAEKRAAGLPREDAEQIARKQIEQDAKAATLQQTETPQTLSQLRTEIEVLTFRTQLLSAKLQRLEQQAAPTPAIPTATNPPSTTPAT